MVLHAAHQRHFPNTYISVPDEVVGEHASNVKEGFAMIKRKCAISRFTSAERSEALFTEGLSFANVNAEIQRARQSQKRDKERQKIADYNQQKSLIIYIYRLRGK